ncbi:MAG TPA: type I-B CRISPR-associated protein Cas5b [Paludibacter sp.]|nr:type I-B CRISPR-associated protein Cas5b [Paludibacter sp.]
MHSDKILVFDIGSEYGHFRKFNTTTSPLTYSIPTRSAITGILGAILGIEREISAGKFREGVIPVAEIFAKENAYIGVQLINPVKKINIAFNLLDTEKTAASFFNIKQRTQIEFELLKNPSFRIFVNLRDEKIFSELIDRIRENKTHFTPYLGLSQFTATVEFRGVTKAKLLQGNNFYDVVTAVNLSNTDPGDPIQFNRSIDFKYTSDTMPVQMLRDRIVTEYSEVVLETNGNAIKIKSGEIYQTDDFGNILFL